MKIVLDVQKSIHENAAKYYEEAKKFEAKRKGVIKALKNARQAGENKPKPISERRKGWFVQFHYFFTSSRLLVLSGKDAKQNDLLGSKYVKPDDLFFHADIIGASATVIKTQGKTPSEQEEREAAQFAACYSRAWKQKYGAVDVYRVTGENISKHSHGEYVGKGAFMILGERKWFKNTELKLKVGLEKGVLVALPFCAGRKLEGETVLAPGDTQKEQLAKQLAKKFRCREEELLKVIPGDAEGLTY